MKQLTERDWQTLHLLLSFRILTAAQLRMVLYPLSVYSRTQVNLQRLYKHRFVDRLVRSNINQPFIYLFSRYSVIGNKLMKEHYGDEYFKSRLQRLGAIDHLIGINDVRALMMRGCQELGYSLVVWQSEEQLAAKLPKSYARPDAYFQVQRPVDGQVKTSGYFLEVQNTSRSSEVIMKKCQSYQRLFFSGEYQRIFGIKGLRVLFVCSSIPESTAETRVKNALKVAEKSGVTLAQFTPLAQLKAAGPVATLLSPVWRSAKSPDGAALLTSSINPGIPEYQLTDEVSRRLCDAQADSAYRRGISEGARWQEGANRYK